MRNYVGMRAAPPPTICNPSSTFPTPRREKMIVNALFFCFIVIFIFLHFRLASMG